MEGYLCGLHDFLLGWGFAWCLVKPAGRPGIDGCRVGAELKSREGYAGRQEASAQILKFTFLGHSTRRATSPDKVFRRPADPPSVEAGPRDPASVQGSLNGAQPQRRNISIDFRHLSSPGIYMPLRWIAVRFLVKIQ